MGGFSSQVQSPQTGQRSAGGKGGSNAGSEVGSIVGQQDAFRAFHDANRDMQGQALAAQTQQNAMKRMGESYTNSATSGQPQMGAPNQYSNTVGMGDNEDQSQGQMQGIGQGKGGGSNQAGASGKGASGKGA